MNSASVRVVADPAEMESLSGVWNRLLEKSGSDASIYLTHEWISTWWRHFGGGSQLHLVLIEMGGEVIGLVPLMRSRYRIGFVRLNILETIGSVNCNCIGLLHPEHRDEAMAALLAYLGEELAGSGAVLRLPLVPDDSSLLGLLRERLAGLEHALAARERVVTVAPYTTLASTWEEFRSSLSRNRKRALRHKMNSLKRGHTVEYVLCDEGSLERRLERFVDIHEERWRSSKVSGLFSNPGMKAFYADVARRFMDRGWLHFSFLDVDGEMASGELAFIYGGKYYGATSARDIRLSRYGIGHLHRAMVIEDAIGRGLKEYDHLKGGEPYKFHWAGDFRKYMDILIMRRGSCAALRFAVVRTLLLLHTVRRYSPNEIYHIYLIRRRESRSLKEMGLNLPG